MAKNHQSEYLLSLKNLQNILKKNPLETKKIDKEVDELLSKIEKELTERISFEEVSQKNYRINKLKIFKNHILKFKDSQNTYHSNRIHLIEGAISFTQHFLGTPPLNEKNELLTDTQSEYFCLEMLENGHSEINKLKENITDIYYEKFKNLTRYLLFCDEIIKPFEETALHKEFKENITSISKCYEIYENLNILFPKFNDIEDGENRKKEMTQKLVSCFKLISDMKLERKKTELVTSKYSSGISLVSLVALIFLIFSFVLISIYFRDLSTSKWLKFLIKKENLI